MGLVAVAVAVVVVVALVIYLFIKKKVYPPSNHNRNCNCNCNQAHKGPPPKIVLLLKKACLFDRVDCDDVLCQLFCQLNQLNKTP